jgi:hypothetical protein
LRWVDEASRKVVPDVGIPSPIELYEASIAEHRVREATGLPKVPIERHPDRHKGDPDDGMDPAFGRRQIDLREPKKDKKDGRAPRPEPEVFLPMRIVPRSAHTIEVHVGYQGNWGDASVPREIGKEESNAQAIATLGLARRTWRMGPHRGTREPDD